MAATALRQIVVYVDDDLYRQFEEIKAADRRNTFSYIGERLFRRGMRDVKQELIPSFPNPTRHAPGRHTRRSR